jgi:hypothetical protein
MPQTLTSIISNPHDLSAPHAEDREQALQVRSTLNQRHGSIRIQGQNSQNPAASAHSSSAAHALQNPARHELPAALSGSSPQRLLAERQAAQRRLAQNQASQVQMNANTNIDDTIEVDISSEIDPSQEPAYQSSEPMNPPDTFAAEARNASDTRVDDEQDIEETIDLTSGPANAGEPEGANSSSESSETSFDGTTREANSATDIPTMEEAVEDINDFLNEHASLPDEIVNLSNEEVAAKFQALQNQIDALMEQLAQANRQNHSHTPSGDAPTPGAHGAGEHDETASYAKAMERNHEQSVHLQRLTMENTARQTLLKFELDMHNMIQEVSGKCSDSYGKIWS